MPMYSVRSKWVDQYVQQRIDEARKSLSTKASKQPVNQESTPIAYEQLNALSDRIARRIAQAMRNRQQPGQYQGRQEQSKPGFQGQYMDEQFRLNGLYEREWKRLHGGN